MKNNKIKIIFITLFLCICICIFTINIFKINNIDILKKIFNYDLNLLNNNENKIKDNKKISNIEFYENLLKDEYEIEKIKKRITDRFIKINDIEKVIEIGANQKELENGYYDIKIYIKENYAVFSVNKLFKNFSLDKVTGTNIKEKIDEKYFEEIINTYIYLFDLKLDEKQKEILKEYVKFKYLELRSIENIDELNKIQTNNEIKISNYKIEVKLEENILNFYTFF